MDLFLPPTIKTTQPTVSDISQSHALRDKKYIVDKIRLVYSDWVLRLICTLQVFSSPFWSKKTVIELYVGMFIQHKMVTNVMLITNLQTFNIVFPLFYPRTCWWYTFLILTDLWSLRALTMFKFPSVGRMFFFLCWKKATVRTRKVSQGFA